MDTNTEIINKLKSLGLTQSEANIYLSCLKLGQTGVSAIARESGINRRNVYDALGTLIDKGLVFNIIGEKEGFYAAINPDKLLELVQSKELAISKIMPDLEKYYKKEFKQEKAFIYKGIDGFKKYLQNILNVGQDVYCIGAKGGWRHEALGSFAKWFEEERINKGIKTYDLFDHEMQKIIPQKKLLYTNLCKNKFLPPEYSTNSAIDVFGDYVVTFTGLYLEKFDDSVSLFIIISPGLAESYRTWFKFMWDNLESINQLNNKSTIQQ